MTVRIGPAVAVDKARELDTMGWEVYVISEAGIRFMQPNFEQLLLITQETRSPFPTETERCPRSMTALERGLLA
jgi:hypothetical protein